MRLSRFAGPLRDPRFRLLWLGRTASHVGSSVAPVVLTLTVIAQTGSASALGVILAAAVAAEMVCYLPAGVLADRLPRRLVMLAAEVVSGVTQLAVGVELLRGVVDTAHLAVAGAVTGAALAFFLPAAQGLTPSTVAADQLRQANALLGVSRRATQVAGPAIATALVLGPGAGWAFVLDGVSFFVGALTLGLLRVRRPVPAPRQRFLTELAGGWAEVRRRRWYWSNLIVQNVWNLGRTVFFILGPLIVVGSLGGALAWGLIVQVGTIGALVGALVAVRVAPEHPLVTANVCLALGSLPLALIAARAHPVLIAVAAGLMYSALGLCGALWDTTVQEQVPEHVLSRVAAYDWLTSVALNPAGLALAGPLAAAFGATQVLYVAAALVAACSLGVLALPDVRMVRSGAQTVPA